MIRRPFAAALAALATALTLTACSTGAVPSGAANSAASSPAADTQTAADACAAMTSVLTEVGADVASIDLTAATKDPDGTLQRFRADADRVGAAVDGLGNGRIRTAAQNVQSVYTTYAEALTSAVQDHDAAAGLRLLQAPKDIADAAQAFSDLCASA
jgi:hypothetical protein